MAIGRSLRACNSSTSAMMSFTLRDCMQTPFHSHLQHRVQRLHVLEPLHMLIPLAQLLRAARRYLAPRRRPRPLPTGRLRKQGARPQRRRLLLLLCVLRESME